MIVPTRLGTIQPLDFEDLDELVRLHGIYLNYGEGIRPHFRSVLETPGTVALKYAVGAEIAGILIYTEGISLSGGHPALAAKIEQFAAGAKIYTGDAVLVQRRFRGMGLSTALYRRAAAELAKRDAELVLHELWVYPDGSVPSRSVIKAFGPWVFLGQFERFYKDFYHYGYVCPICGGDCVCTAQLYLSKLKGESAPWEESGWVSG